MTQNAKYTAGPWLAHGRGIFAGNKILAEGKHPSDENAIADYEEVLANTVAMAATIELIDVARFAVTRLTAVESSLQEGSWGLALLTKCRATLAKAGVKP